MYTEITAQEARKLELVELIMDYLADWQDDESQNKPQAETLFEIMGYLDGFNLDDTFVIAAIRHAQDVMVFWNKESLREWLAEIGFTNEEGDYYFEKWISGDWMSKINRRQNNQLHISS
jgi:hypothetical protein